MHNYFRSCSTVFLAVTALLSASAADYAVRTFSPDAPGEFTLVRDATSAALKKSVESGEKPLAESAELIDDAVAYTNFAQYAAAVAFEKLPRANLLHTWKSLGVTVLKTVKYRDETSPEHFRREAGFLAFQQGADGLWIPEKASLSQEYLRAIDEAKEDWRILLYLRDLSEKAAAHENKLVQTDHRRVSYWFGYMPAAWENLDTLRLETVAWAKRLEQILGLPPANLPTTLKGKPLPTTSKFTPFADLGVTPTDIVLDKAWQGKTVELGEGLSFRADYAGFSISFNTTNGPVLEQGQNPGGSLDFRFYIPGTNRTDLLPYRIHCDLEKWWTGPRAPALGRGSYLYGTDERFKPYSLAYENTNTKVYTLPRLRSFGRNYPDPRPSFRLVPNKGGGYKVTVEIGWLALYGLWPTLEDNVKDVWYVGLDRNPDTRKPLAFRITWPKGYKGGFEKFASRITTGAITQIYKAELQRTAEVWNTAFSERYYGFVKTKDPCFNRYDLESDNCFRDNLAKPVFDGNENAWQLIWTDKEHQHPQFNKQQDAVKMSIWKKLGDMLYMSYDIGIRRRDYLLDRFAGKAIKKYEKKKDGSRATAPSEPDADFDGNAIQLDELEF